ncbi:MAG: SRPBCC family protein [Firmicutes bacterium]|nr:SRPBCC family protein [Bacillota bacterium]
MVVNIHSREYRAALDEVGALIDGLSSQGDRLWPYERWGPMFFDRPLEVGAVGGHGGGTIGYVIEKYEPGRYIRFRFTNPAGFIGTHCFDVEETSPEMVRLRHTIRMELMGESKKSWPLAIRWLHDALIEDAFDKAAATLQGQPVVYREQSWWVKFLLKQVRRKREKAEPGKKH